MRSSEMVVSEWFPSQLELWFLLVVSCTSCFHEYMKLSGLSIFTISALSVHRLDAMRSLEISSNIDHWVIYLPGLRSVFRFLICYGESLTLTSHAVCRFQQSNWLIWPLFHTKMKCFFCSADEKRWLEVSNNTVLEMKASKKKREQQIEFLLKCIWFPLPLPLPL